MRGEKLKIGFTKIGRLLLALILVVILSSCNFYSGRGKTGSANGEPLADAPEVLHITSVGHFQEEVLDHDGPVLVDFSADWCPPCRAMSPMVNSIAVELEGELKVVKVFDKEKGYDNRELFKSNNVGAIPAFKIFMSGNEIASSTGGRSYATFKAWVEDNI